MPLFTTSTSLVLYKNKIYFQNKKLFIYSSQSEGKQKGRGGFAGLYNQENLLQEEAPLTLGHKAIELSLSAELRVRTDSRQKC